MTTGIYKVDFSSPNKKATAEKTTLVSFDSNQFIK
jgi:hypothetical protein